MEYNIHSYVELSCIMLTLAVSCLCVIYHMFKYSNCHIFFVESNPHHQINKNKVVVMKVSGAVAGREVHRAR
jgi:RsiW-degrading membrane proteinase PrsW (M82 family)